MKKLRSLLASTATLILSLTLAIVIWFNAVQEQDPDTRRSVQIPATYVGLPENVIIVEPTNPDQAILVTYEGRSSIVTDLSEGDFSAVIDLSEVPIGERQSIPVNIEATTTEIAANSTPSEIAILLEELKTVSIPVEVDIRGSEARGHIRQPELLEPTEIVVTGIASEVDDLDFAQVTVFLNDENQTFIDNPRPIFYDQQGQVASVSNLDISADVVQVTIPIQESADFAEKIISVDIVGEPADGYRLLSASVSPSTILVTGRPTQLQVPFNVRTEPIDITGLTESFNGPVTLVLPEGIELDEVEEIIVDVQIEPFRSTKIFNQPVVVQGVDLEKEADVTPESVRVVLFGPLPILETITEQELLVTVDGFGLENGEYTVEPVVNFPEQRDLELRSIQPSVVTLQITDTLTTTNGISNTLPITDASSMLYNRPVEVMSSMDLGVEDTAVSHHHPSKIIAKPQPIYLKKNGSLIIAN